jgi:hypothetical protein
MTPPQLASVPIRSADDLTARWTTVLDPPIFGARSLWVIWLDDDGLMLPIIVPVDDLPSRPDRELLSGLLQVASGVLDDQLPDDDGHIGFALCRPGPPEVSEDDDDWAEALRDAFDESIDGTWSLHLAAAGRVTQLVGPPPFLWRHRRRS